MYRGAALPHNQSKAYFIFFFNISILFQILLVNKIFQMTVTLYEYRIRKLSHTVYRMVFQNTISKSHAILTIRQFPHVIIIACFREYGPRGSYSLVHSKNSRMRFMALSFIKYVSKKETEKQIPYAKIFRVNSRITPAVVHPQRERSIPKCIRLSNSSTTRGSICTKFFSV